LKKIIFIIITVAVLGLGFYYFKNIYGWIEFRKNTETPDQFLSKTLNKKEDYTKDSLIIAVELKNLLLRHEHEDFFYSKEYFEGALIIVDTILYSPDFNKLAILFLTKNPTSRQLMPTENYEFYYNATAYLGVRQKDTISLSFLGPSFSNSIDKKELSKLTRQTFFRMFVSKDTTAQYANKYNLNDTRFWTGSEWKKIEEDKIKRQEFEEEKIKHPENVYEPKN
jgi:hypothetical protein